MRLPEAIALIRRKVEESTDTAGTIADFAFFFQPEIDAGDLDGFELAGAIADSFAGGGVSRADTIRIFNDAVKVWRAHHEKDKTPAATNDFPEDTGFSDAGFLTRFIKLHPCDFFFVAEWNTWTAWTGEKWESDHGEALLWEAVTRASLVFESVELLEIKTDALLDGEAREAKTRKCRAFFTRLRNAAGCKAIATMAAHDMRFRKTSKDFDQHHFLLNCNNGTLDLTTGQIRAFNRSDFLTRQIATDYEPTAKAPTWFSFLEQIIPDYETRSFLNLALGYSLTGAVDEQCMFICYGGGSNGKSTFIEAVEHIASCYHVKAAMSTFTVRESDAGSDLARMRAARFVTVSENDENARLSEGLVKTATGDNQITARELYRNPFTYSPRFKVWMAVNHRPIIRGQDDGIWRRLKLIPFEVKIPDSAKDTQLAVKLRAEAAGILAWMVRGAILWQKHTLATPARVTAAGAGYREEMDVIGRWIEENCETDSAYEQLASELYSNFSEWAKASGEFPMTNTLFGRRLGDRGFQAARAGSGKKIRTGIQLNMQERNRRGTFAGFYATAN